MEFVFTEVFWKFRLWHIAIPALKKTNVSSFDSSYRCMAGDLILAVPGGPHTAGNAVGGTEFVSPPAKMPRTESALSKSCNPTLREGVSNDTLGDTPEPHEFWQDAQTQQNTMMPKTPEGPKVTPKSGGQVPTPLGNLSRKPTPSSFTSRAEEKKMDADETTKFDKYYHQLLYTYFSEF